MSLDKQKPSIPPAFYSKQPHVQYKLNKDDDDGMEHLDEEVSTYFTHVNSIFIKWDT